MRFLSLGLLLFLVPVSALVQYLACSPCSYDFGKLKIGDSVSYSIELTNNASKTLTILSKSLKGSAFSFGHFPVPIKISPWSSIELPVIFTPKTARSTDGVITITSNAPDSPFTIDVSGIGVSDVAAQLAISPAKLSFGNVTVGSSASLQATLTASKAEVTISSDRSTSSEFSIAGLNFPVTIPAGKSIPVTIQFTPSSSGTDPAKVGFVSNATGSPTVADVTGTGVAQGSYSVSLAWDASSGSVLGYNVYRGDAQAGPFQQINTALEASTNYTDSTVVSGATYYYVTTAVNAEGQQSAYSNAAKAVVP